MLEAWLSTGLIPTGPEVQLLGKRLGPDKVGNGRGCCQARGSNEAGDAVAAQTRGPTRSGSRQQASSGPEARSSTGLKPTKPEAQSLGESLGPVDIRIRRRRRQARGPTRQAVQSPGKLGA